MRTTLDIDEDVLQAVKEIAEMKRITAGKALSELAAARWPQVITAAKEED